MAKRVCADAARTLAEAAVAAGAPDGVIQVVDEPSIPLINALMTDERTDVIVATGGSAVVRAAYRSGTPAIGVGPGNVPVLVDATADLPTAAKRIVDSKSFDNSILCTNESVLIVRGRGRRTGFCATSSASAPTCSSDGERGPGARPAVPGRALRRPLRRQGRDLDRGGGRRCACPATPAILLAPFDLVVPEEPLAHEKLCPVLGLVRVPNAAGGIDAARAVLRITGRGHSAAIHSTIPRTIMEFGAGVAVLRVVGQRRATASAAPGSRRTWRRR